MYSTFYKIFLIALYYNPEGRTKAPSFKQKKAAKFNLVKCNY